MAFVYEPIPREEWEFMESLYIGYIAEWMGKWYAISPKEELRWFADYEREIFMFYFHNFLNVLWLKGDYCIFGFDMGRMTVVDKLKKQYKTEIKKLQIPKKLWAKKNDILQILDELFPIFWKIKKPENLFAYIGYTLECEPQILPEEVVVKKSFFWHLSMWFDLLMARTHFLTWATWGHKHEKSEPLCNSFFPKNCSFCDIRRHCTNGNLKKIPRYRIE